MDAQERRALAVVLALLVLAAAARWMERPRALLLEDVPALDVAALEAASREAKPPPRRPVGGGSGGGGAAPAGAGPGTGAGAGVGAAVDLNRASVQQMQALPGVGPVLAARLVARRDSLGGFRDWADVDAVRGVGPAMLARLQAQARLGP